MDFANFYLGVSRPRLRLLRLRGSGASVCAPALSAAGRDVGGVTVGDVRHRRRRYAGTRVLGNARVDAKRVDLGGGEGGIAYATSDRHGETSRPEDKAYQTTGNIVFGTSTCG